MTRILCATLFALALAPAAWAEDKPGRERPIVTPPPPPEALSKGKEIEPGVTIVRRGWATIEEYSVNGRVYAVKVTPIVGLPYYLYDADADGNLETRIEGTGPINRWNILTW